MMLSEKRQAHLKLKAQYEALRFQRANKEKDLLIYAKNPEWYPEEMILYIRTEHARLATEQGQALTQLVQMEQDPELAPPAPVLDDAPVLLDMSEVEQEEIPWLWAPFLPLRNITMLDGDPGNGKSWFCLAVATCTTLGAWLDIGNEGENFHEPSSVIYVSTEDDPTYTIKKRCNILGMDQTKFFVMRGKTKNQKTTGVNLRDISTFEQAITQRQAKLLILDPLSAYFPA